MVDTDGAPLFHSAGGRYTRTENTSSLTHLGSFGVKERKKDRVWSARLVINERWIPADKEEPPQSWPPDLAPP